MQDVDWFCCKRRFLAGNMYHRGIVPQLTELTDRNIYTDLPLCPKFLSNADI